MISIILPVYNSEKYITECVDSILDQNYSNFEILLINDGSTDMSGDICESYANKDARIKVIHKENGGVSSARNLGIENSTGEWISFVDSDDILCKGYLKELFKATNQDVDVIIQGFQKISKISKNLYDCGVGTVTSKELIKLFEKHKIIDYGFPFAKLYRRSIILENNILFNTKATIAEDLMFLLEYLVFARKIVFQSVHNYGYITREQSLINTFHLPIVYFNQYILIKEVLKRKYEVVFKDLYENQNSNSSFKHTQKTHFATLLKMIKTIYYKKLSKRDRFYYFKKMQANDRSFIRNNKVLLKNSFLQVPYFFLEKNFLFLADCFFYLYYSITYLLRTDKIYKK